MYKLPIEFAYGNLTAKVSKRNRHGEYVVKFYENGKHLKDADYFATEKDDAINTAKYSLKSMYEKRVNEGSANFDQQLDKKYNNKSDKEWDDQIIIKVVDQFANVGYYTGRSGEGWLTSNPNDAFTGYNEIGVKNWIERNKHLAEIQKVKFIPITLSEAKKQHNDSSQMENMFNAFKNMERNGGSFARALAQAWFKADLNNQAIIEKSFEYLISQYKS